MKVKTIYLKSVSLDRFMSREITMGKEIGLYGDGHATAMLLLSTGSIESIDITLTKKEREQLLAFFHQVSERLMNEE